MRPKLKTLIAGAAMLGSLLLMTTVAVAQTLDDVPSFRCDGGTVTVGDRQYAVRRVCGEPEKITVSGGGAVEEWVYNFGPTKFIYYVTFKNGRLERIQAGEHGFEE
jgi:hypothetical protein